MMKRVFQQLNLLHCSFSDLNLPDTKKHLRTKPIFIVGMPRSGTTLVEQIISNHSLVHAGGEPHSSLGVCDKSYGRES